MTASLLGEGAEWFFDGTNEDGSDGSPRNECRRSDAYALIANQVGAFVDDDDFLFVACSGARIPDVLERAQYPDSPEGVHGGFPQIEYVLQEDASGNRTLPDPSIGIVTLTIGGNDFGFNDILQACIGSKGPDLRLRGGEVRFDVPWLLEFAQVAAGTGLGGARPEL